MHPSHREKSHLCISASTQCDTQRANAHAANTANTAAAASTNTNTQHPTPNTQHPTPRPTLLEQRRGHGFAAGAGLALADQLRPQPGAQIPRCQHLGLAARAAPGGLESSLLGLELERYRHRADNRYAHGSAGTTAGAHGATPHEPPQSPSQQQVSLQVATARGSNGQEDLERSRAKEAQVEAEAEVRYRAGAA